MINNITVITNSSGKFINHEYDREPNPGSVVTIYGPWGTAFQRYFGGDGLWHRVGGGRGKTWAQLLTMPDLILIYDAPVRPEDPVERGAKRIRHGRAHHGVSR